jgi:hypothetical protein
MMVRTKPLNIQRLAVIVVMSLYAAITFFAVYLAGGRFGDLSALDRIVKGDSCFAPLWIFLMMPIGIGEMFFSALFCLQIFLAVSFVSRFSLCGSCIPTPKFAHPFDAYHLFSPIVPVPRSAELGRDANQGTETFYLGKSQVHPTEYQSCLVLSTT